MTTTIVKEIKIDGGEIVVYKDADGFHAERWSDTSQAIVRQSGDCKTQAEAIDRVS